MKSVKFYCTAAMAALVLMGVGVSQANAADNLKNNVKVSEMTGKSETVQQAAYFEYGKIHNEDSECKIVGLSLAGKQALENGKSLVIPDKGNGYYRNKVVSTIGKEAFSSEKDQPKITGTLTLSRDLTKIEDSAFAGNEITKVLFNAENTSLIIGKHAFANNLLRDNLSIPNSVRKIGESAFSNNSISLEESNNKNDSLSSVEITPPNNTTLTVGSNAFSGHSITKIEVKDSNRKPYFSPNAFSDQRISSSVTYQEPLPLENIENYNDPTISYLGKFVDTYSITPNPESQVNYSKGKFTQLPAGGSFAFTVTPNSDSTNNFSDLGYSLHHTVNVGEKPTPPGPENPDPESPETGSPEAPGINIGGGSSSSTNNTDKVTSDNTSDPTIGTTVPTTGTTGEIVDDLESPQGIPSADSQPHSVYNKKAIRLHKTVELNKPTKAYKKVPRNKAKTFKVLGVSYSKNGAKRYRVNGGYITANKKYVANAHYQSVPKSAKVKVVSNNGLHLYRDAKLKTKVRHVKKNQTLKVKNIVKQGNMTRYQLSNNHYISTNKTLIMWK
ncbi:hypothetical protein YK48G_08790 [Lentilactobacillus fungorum]|uniref:DUF5776 domain-containing protein n=1 Tax=Lentilactobacillus fungorum TaxID=2201250 RepID=A0ABQ3VYN3_9LACO|nr:DUF5776 domain-containing protein [Lentilactobacillus fungorum]GHP13454.1 hypothetical protein YK48G_08790 [Lentilactobacillus fungorum]